MRRTWLLGFVGLASLLAAPRSEAAGPIRVVVWDEQQPVQKQAYPNFLGNAIADYLKKQPGLEVKSVRQDDPEQGLSKATLDNTDVLIWWGHVRQGEIKPEKAKEIVARIKAGKLSLIALHSAHWSEPFVEAMRQRTLDELDRDLGDEKKNWQIQVIQPPRFAAPKRDDPLTPSVRKSIINGKKLITLTLPNCCFPAYREDGKPSHVTVLKPDHLIARGIPAKFDIPATEMYEEPFHVPAPDEVVFEEKWERGEHFRSGSVWKLGQGRVVYFRPGHETHPVYLQAEPLKIIENTVRFLSK